MSACVYACVRVYVHAHVRTCAILGVCAPALVHVRTSVCILARVRVNVHADACVRMDVCMHGCVSMRGARAYECVHCTFVHPRTPAIACALCAACVHVPVRVRVHV